MYIDLVVIQNAYSFVYFSCYVSVHMHVQLSMVCVYSLLLGNLNLSSSYLEV